MEEGSSYDDLIGKHRKEKKELMAKIQKMKHAIPKGDKKKKKEVTVEVALILAELDLKHEKEIKEFEVQNSSVELILTDLKSPEISTDQNDQDVNLQKDQCTSEQETLEANPPQKLSKAQKRRNRKSENAKERQRAIDEQELINLTGNRSMEYAEIKKKLDKRHLAIYEISSDGNCLYNAIEHQLSTLNLQKLSMETLRKLTSEYLLIHKADYIPFLTDAETGDTFSDEQYVKYCEDIVNTSAWGGHVEVQALSHVCGKPIEVIQAEGPSIIAGNENDNPKLIISYHRYAYGLGEHYNSVIPC